MFSVPSTYEEFALVDVFAPAVGVFHLFAEYERHLKKEEVALSTLADESLRVPNLKRLLKDELTLGLDVFIKTWQKTTTPQASAVIFKGELQIFHPSADSAHHLPAWRDAWHHWLSWEH